MEKSKVDYIIFNKVQPNSTQSSIMDAAQLGRYNQYNFVIGLDAGSSIDSAKAIAVMMLNEGVLRDYAQTGTGKRKPIFKIDFDNY